LATEKARTTLVDMVVEKFLSKTQKAKRQEDLEEKKRLKKRREQVSEVNALCDERMMLRMLT